MAVISGKRALISGVGTARNWRINHRNELQSPRAQNTDAYPFVIEGNFDWTGSTEFYGYTPPLLPGDSFTLKASEDTAAGTAIWTAPAMVSRISVVIDPNAATPISGVIDFASNGELEIGAEAITDTSSPNVYPSKTRAATWAGTDIANVERMEFELACELHAYRTGGASGTDGQTKRVAGNQSGSGRFTVAEGGHPMTAVLLPGDKQILRYYVTATAYWEFKWATISDRDPSAERETGVIVKKNYSWLFSGFMEGTPPTEGYIRKPDLSYLWQG